MNNLIPLAIFSSVSVTTLLFFIVYINALYKGNKLSKLLFSGLLLATSVRIIKSVVYYLFNIPLIGTALGFIGLSYIGVFTWLYFKYSSDDSSKFNPKDLIHFGFGFVGFFLIWPFNIGEAKALYTLANTISIIYLLVSWLMVYRKKSSSKLISSWNTLVLISVTIVLGAFVYQLFSSSLFEYALGAGIASIITYVLFFFVLKNGRLFAQAINNTATIEASLMRKIEQALDVEKVYKQNSMTITQFSSYIGAPSYKVSMALKEKYRKPFPELINYYRVNEIKERMLKGEHKLFKIESLAFDAGYSSPSSFYTAFKKETGTTPKAFIQSNCNGQFNLI